MSRRLAILGVLGMLACPAFAAHRVSFDQLQQLLATAAAQHKPDDSVALQVYDAEPVVRLSEAALTTLIAASPGPNTTHALRAFADESVFLDPPASEIPTRPTPDVAAQRYMMTQTIHYVARTLHSLPNFLATRQTDSFDDAPHVETAGQWPLRGGFRYRASFEAPIAYRDGNEIDDAATRASTGAVEEVADHKKPRKPSPAAAPGLSSWGEFGPVLEILILDASKGKLGWSRWGQYNGKLVAVFQFSIPQSISHYNVQYKNRHTGETVGAYYGSGGSSSGLDKNPGSEIVREIAGYHGLLTIDPETGAVLRISIEADLPATSGLQKAAMMVEYAPVHIGDSEHICPVHSVTLSLVRDVYKESPTAGLANIIDLQLNDVRFTDYRRFGSDAKLLMTAEASSAARPDSSGSADPSTPSVAAPNSAPASTSTPQPSTTSPAASVETATTASPAPPQPAAPPARPAPAESDEELIVRDVAELPGIGAPDEPAKPAGATAQPGTFTLQVSTRLVDLGLIAMDKHGKPIADLKPDEIELYDNGRKQHIAAFHHATPTPVAVAAAAPAPAADDGIFTNTAPPADTQDVPDLLVLMMDESHLPYNDLNRARGEVERFLQSARPNSRIALYAVSEHGFRVIQDVTTDHALVEARLASWQPTAAASSQAAELDQRNYQHFDYVRNPSDLDYVNGNHGDSPDYITSADPNLRQLGDDPLGSALVSMVTVAHHFAPVQGHKSLVWISGDSVLVNWDDQTVSMERRVKEIDAAINRTKEALNEAHMALYAVDASMVSTGAAAVDASLFNADVGLNPVATENSKPGGAGLPRNIGGRMSSQLQQDSRGIQGTVRQLAEGTGGRAINKGSDLKATLDSIEQDSTALYEVGFNPDTQADNKFHTLLVKIPGRKDVKLRYRAGYLYNEEASTSKERFQQAVWSPQDLNGISLTAIAEPAEGSGPDANSGAFKLRIALAGLGLQQKDGHWDDNLYIFVARRDEAAQKAEITGDTLKLSLKPATYENGMPAGIPYRHPVEVKSKLGSVRVIVVDGNSGKMGSVTIPSSALAK
jgi:VWFA-related protein